MKNIYSKIALTIISIAIAISSVACSGGVALDVNPDKGLATDAAKIAYCIKAAGNDTAKAAQCLK